MIIQTARGAVVVRTTRGEDAAALRELRLEALTSCPTAFGTSPGEAEREDWALRAAEGAGEGAKAIFVAEAGGELVGMTGAMCSERPKSRHSAFIWGVYVRPAWRGLRLSEALVGAAMEWVAGKGRGIVRLTVSKGNTAIRVYERCGYEVYGVEPASMVVEGVEIDELLMAKRLAAGAV